MQLQGHLGEIYTVKFSPDGEYLASAGHDRLIYFWEVFPRTEGEPTKNLGVLKGHKNAILELQWGGSGNDRLFTASSDRQIFVWDTMEGFKRTRKMKGHQNVVNAIDTLRRPGAQSELVVSGSDDFTVKLWDERVKNFVRSYELDYQVTSVAFSRGVGAADYIFVGGLDNSVKAINLSKNAIEFALLGHTDTVTGISVSPDGKSLVSNSMDNTVKIWDIRPFVVNNDDSARCLHTLYGVQHNFEKNLLRTAWNADSTQVTAGSADRFVQVWDVAHGAEGRMVQRLGGHMGSVNEVAFNPNPKHARVIASASSDKTLVVGELQ